MPAHLRPRAKRLWKALVEQLDALGLMTKVDGAALEGCCMAYDRAVEADKVIARKGLIFDVVKDGVVVMSYQRPEIAISQNAWKQYRAFCSDFGLTPASRGKLALPAPEASADPLEAALAAPRVV